MIGEDAVQAAHYLLGWFLVIRAVTAVTRLRQGSKHRFEILFEGDVLRDLTAYSHLRIHYHAAQLSP